MTNVNVIKGNYQSVLKQIVESYYKNESENLAEYLNFVAADLTVPEVICLYAEVREMLSGEHVIRVSDLDVTTKNRITGGRMLKLVS